MSTAACAVTTRPARGWGALQQLYGIGPIVACTGRGRDRRRQLLPSACQIVRAAHLNSVVPELGLGIDASGSQGSNVVAGRRAGPATTHADGRLSAAAEASASKTRRTSAASQRWLMAVAITSGADAWTQGTRTARQRLEP